MIRALRALLAAALAAVSFSGYAQQPSQADLVWQPYDGQFGMTCDYFNKMGQMYWLNRGGDWRGADGVDQGSVPFVSITTTAGDTTVTAAIPPALLASTTRLWFMRYTGATGTFQFWSKEAGPSLRPQLLVTLADSSVVALSPIADQTLQGPAVAGGECTATVGPQDNFVGINGSIVLAWPAFPANAVSAQLVLKMRQAVTSPAQVGIFAGVPPRKPLPPYTAGAIAPAYEGDIGICSDPRVLFCENFSPQSFKGWASRTGGYYAVDNPYSWECDPLLDTDQDGACDQEDKIYRPDLVLSRLAQEGGNTFWRMRYAPDTTAGTAAPTKLFPGGTGDAEKDEMYVRYRVRFGSGFYNQLPVHQCPDGGKLPGIAGNTDHSGQSGAPGTDGQGWSMRGAYHIWCDLQNPVFQAGFNLFPYIYAYHLDQEGEYGDDWTMAGAETLGMYATGVWYTMEHRVKINSIVNGVAQADGIMQVWMDGRLVLDRQNVRFRGPGPYLYNASNTAGRALKINRLWGAVHHGGKFAWGSSAANGLVYIDVDDYIAATERIGPVAPLVTNLAPSVAAPIPNQIARVGDAFSFAFSASAFADLNNDTLVYTASGLPAWLSFDAATRTFSGTPGAGNIGVTAITVRATDPAGLFAEDVFDLSAQAANNPPVLASPLADATGTTGQPLSVQFSAAAFTDPDAGDTLTYTASGMPSGVGFTAATRTFGGVPSVAGAYTITVRATDVAGLFVEDQFVVTVAQGIVTTLTATPSSSPAGTQITVAWANIINATGSNFIGFYTPAATVMQHNGHWFYVNCTKTAGGAMPSRSCAFTIPAGTALGQYQLRLYNSSQVLQVATGFSVVPANQAPVITPLIDRAAPEDTAFAYDIASAIGDPNPGDVLTVTATGMPAWMSFNATARTFTGTPAQSDIGMATITVRVTDAGGLFVEDAFTVEVTNTNDAPTLASAPANQSAAEDALFSYALPAGTFADADPGDALTLSAVSMPAWMVFDVSTATFGGTPAQADVGTVTVTVRATDTAGATVDASFDVAVAATNDAPTVSGSIGDQSATGGQAFALTLDPVLFADVDGDALAITASNMPGWLSFNGSAFTGTPGASDNGATPIVVRATDPAGLFVETGFVLDVQVCEVLPVANPTIVTVRSMTVRVCK